MSETLTWSDPIENKKIKTHYAKIVVECTTGKPYYSIEWFDVAKKEYYLGYSSYCIDNVLGWIKEFFEIVEAPKTNADRIRAMSDEELANTLWDIGLDIWNCNEYNGQNVTILPQCEKCDGNCESVILKWLKQPAEEE